MDEDDFKQTAAEVADEILNKKIPKSKAKRIAKDAMLRGYELGYGVEELEAQDYKVVERKFDEWWSKNVDN